MLTKGAIGNLINRYRAVLAKCNLINTFGSLAVAAALVLGGAGVAGAASVWENPTAPIVWNGEGGTLHYTKDHNITDFTGELKVVDNPIDAEPAEGTIGLQAASGNTRTNSGSIWAVRAASSKYVAAMECAPNDDNSTIINDIDGKIFVEGNNLWNAKGMSVNRGIAQNYGLIVVKGQASGMTDNSGAVSKKLINYGTIAVEGNGAGIFYRKEAQSAADAVRNEGTISVSGGGFGLYMRNDSNYASFNGKKFANSGTIKADADSTAIFIDSTNNAKVTNTGTVEGSVVINNVTANDAVLENKRTLEVVNGNISNNVKNHSDLVYGVVFNNGGTASFTDTTFENNTFAVGKEATRYGAIYNAHGSMEITGGEFKNNISANMGGAIYSSTKLDITDVTFTGNKAQEGGVLYHNNNITTFTDCTFTGNEATARSGGAIAVEGQNQDTPSVVFKGKNEFTSNKAAQNGGALFLFEAGAPKVVFEAGSETEFKENSAKYGGAIYNNSTLTIEDGNSTFSGNTAFADGGAIYNGENSTLTISGNSSFANNKATATDGWGGAIFNKGTLEISGGTFSGNTAQESGGAIATSTSSKKTAIDGVTFDANHATNDGGAIVACGPNLSISNSVFSNNTAQYANDGNNNWNQPVSNDITTIGGGAIALGAESTTEITSITDTTFKNNKSGTYGGAIGTRMNYYDHKGTPASSTNPAQFTNPNNEEAALDIAATFIGNEAKLSGGAIFNNFYHGDASKGEGVTVTGIFESNKAGKNGGAIYNNGGPVFTGTATSTSAGYDEQAVMTVYETSFTGNSAGVDGGAIFNGGTLYVEDSTFENNTADSVGGAIASGTKSVLTAIKNATFSDNHAVYDGGAIGNYGPMTIENASFIGNTAGSEGGAIFNTGTLHLSGTNTFSGNTAAGKPNDIHNDGTLTVAEGGTVYLDGGITGEGTITGNGTFVYDLNTTVKQDSSTGWAKASAELNDRLGGDLVAFKQLVDLSNGLEVIGMEEGMVAPGYENGKFSKNEVMDAVLQQASITTFALDRILTNDVRKRLGDIRSDANTTGVWMRWDGGKLKGDSGLTNNFNTIQIGGDTKVAKNCRIGFAGSFTHGDMDFNKGGGELEGFSFALYGTWMGENGMFADVVARLGKFSTEMNALGRKGDMDNRVASLSGEYGWRFDLAQQFFIEPQVELAYTYVSSDDLQLGEAHYEFDSVDSLTGRAGVVAGWNLPEERGNIYARASVVQQFLGDAEITGAVTGGKPVTQKHDGEDTWLEYGIGANVKLTDNTYVWADVERTEGAEIEEEWRGTVGIRYSF